MSGRAPQAPAYAARFLRVATFNLWGGNEHTQAITAFLARTDADVVVLEEVQEHHKDLLAPLDKQYPHCVGDNGLVIPSKYPMLADGRIDRAGEPPWMSLIIRWVKLDVNGKEVELAGVQLARPSGGTHASCPSCPTTTFASRHFGSLGTTVGSYLGLDHRPVVADIALMQ